MHLYAGAGSNGDITENEQAEKNREAILEVDRTTGHFREEPKIVNQRPLNPSASALTPSRNGPLLDFRFLSSC
jgi:hypothetical protein